MYKIKQTPEDFIVREVPLFSENDLSGGEFAYFLLIKRNITTRDAIEEIAKLNHIPFSLVNVSGYKDKAAVAYQYFSIHGWKDTSLRALSGVSVQYIGHGKTPLCLGSLRGNEFTITVRCITKKKYSQLKGLLNKAVVMPNYFGEQRFSERNHLIGKAVVKKDFQKAVSLIIHGKGPVEDKVREFISEHPSNPIGALQSVPLKLLQFFIHAYQSSLFNALLKTFIAQGGNPPEKLKLPLIGFGTDIEDLHGAVKGLVRKLLAKERLSPNDFITRSFPHLSSEGTEREAFLPVKGIHLGEILEDELNKGKKKVVLSFFLPKNTYATELIKHLLLG